MKVLIVTPEFPSDPTRINGGVASACYNLAQVLRTQHGLEVEVLLVSPTRQTAEGAYTIQVTGLRVHQVGCRHKRPSWWDILWRLPQAALDRIGRLTWDVVHVHGLERVAARLPRRSVLTIHGLNEVDARFRGGRWLCSLRASCQKVLLGRARRRVTRVIAISSYVQRLLPPNPERRVWYIANPVPDSFFDIRRQPIPGRVVAVGRLVPIKNTEGLIRGFAQVARRHRRAELRLAGAGETSYELHCRALARQLGLKDRIRFLGPLTVAELQAELSVAACVALVSFHENAPMALVEAQAAGVAAVASDVGGIPDLVQDGVTGRLVDPQQPSDIARGLEQLLFADDLRALGQAARRRAEAHHRGPVVGSKTIEVYSRLLEEA